MDLVEDDQLPQMVGEVEFWFGKFGAVLFRFKIQIERAARLSQSQGQRCLARLARPEQHHGRYFIQTLQQNGKESPLNHVCNYGTVFHELQ